MNHMPAISVVIPTKNRCRFLQRVLPIYLSQPEVAEVVVVVDGSTDGTLEYLETFAVAEPRVRFVSNGINRGTPFSKNRGIDEARSEYIFIGEDDLEVTDGFFATLLQHKHKTGADLISGRNIFRFEDESATEALARTGRMKGEPVNLKTIEINTSIAIADDCQQVMIAAPALGKAELFRAVRFDERYKVNFWREETDHQFAVQEAGYALWSCPHAICYNYMIKNDRGGARTAVGFRRVRWMIINNWRFVKKHRAFIAEHCAIGNPYVYIALFALKKAITDLLMPLGSPAKQLIVCMLQRLKPPTKTDAAGS